MAISELVDYEAVHELSIKGPNGGAEIGVTFKVKSGECDAAKSVARRMINKQAVAQSKGKHYPIEEAERDVIERIAASIVDWDWGGQEFDRGEGEPEFNRKNLIHVLTKAGWIFDQVNEYVGNLENFTKQ